MPEWIEIDGETALWCVIEGIKVRHYDKVFKIKECDLERIAREMLKRQIIALYPTGEYLRLKMR